MTILDRAGEVVDKLPHIDIPGSWVDCIVLADCPFAVGPLFTRDPGHIIELQILIGMMVSAAGMSGIRYTR